MVVASSELNTLVVFMKIDIPLPISFPYPISEKNNKIELVKKMIFEIVDKHNSNVGVIDQDLGLEWIST